MRIAVNVKCFDSIRARAGLAMDYGIIFSVNLKTGVCHDIDISDYYREKIDEIDPRPSRESYGERMGLLSTCVVFCDDLKHFLEGTSLNRVAEELKNASEYSVVYRVYGSNGLCRYRNKYVKDDTSGSDDVIVGIRKEDAVNIETLPMYSATSAYNSLGSEQDEQNTNDAMDSAPAADASSANAEGSKLENDFIYSLSHGIRTPLNAILGFASMIEQHRDNPNAILDSVNKIKASGQDMLRLVNDLLELNGIENGTVSNILSVTELDELVRYTVETHKASAVLKGVSLSFNTSGITNDEVVADAYHLRQILGNLIDNSIKYTESGGKVNILVDEFDCDRPGYSTYRFTIIDTGIGMKPEAVERYLSARDYEYSDRIAAFQGVGIGVTVIKWLVSLMGGTINVVSHQGVGTKVICSFDLKHCADDEKKSNISVNLTGRRVLLVEDNSLNREIARDILERENMSVEEAYDGAVAVDMVCSSEPGYYDFILMDIQMPYMDGYEAAREIRQLDDRKLAGIPIIALTANVFEQDRSRSIEAGMNAHLAKPVDVNELVSLLRKIQPDR